MRFKYQASIFADLNGLSATSENTVRLLTQLNANNIELLPSTFHEIAPPNMAPVPRLRFASPSGDAEVLVAIGRLDVMKQVSLLSDAAMEPIGVFAEFAERCVSAVLHGRNVMGTRLALIIQATTGEQPPATLNAHFPKLFTPPNFYNQRPPIEWTFRANSRMNLQFGQFNESVNSILKTERVQGQALGGGGGWQEFDRVLSEFDVNTLTTNNTPRFSTADLRSFMLAAGAVVDGLEADLAARLVINI